MLKWHFENLESPDLSKNANFAFGRRGKGRGVKWSFKNLMSWSQDLSKNANFALGRVVVRSSGPLEICSKSSSEDLLTNANFSFLGVGVGEGEKWHLSQVIPTWHFWNSLLEHDIHLSVNFIRC